MNALLVYPRFPITYWGFQYGLRLVGKRAVLPPLGLIAGMESALEGVQTEIAHGSRLSRSGCVKPPQPQVDTTSKGLLDSSDVDFPAARHTRALVPPSAARGAS